jgi:serine/threonine protein kinase
MIDEIGDLIWSEGYGHVRKAIEIRSGKSVAMKSVNMKTMEKRKIGKREEDNYKELKGKSPYLADVIDIFEDVWIFFL